jgi:hypothetical protein
MVRRNLGIQKRQLFYNCPNTNTNINTDFDAIQVHIDRMI